MDQFTPVSAIFGGCLIGLAAVCFLYFNRQICGISGIVGGLLPPVDKGVSWRMMFVLGLLFGGFVLRFVYPAAFEFTLADPLKTIVIAGFLVGFGSRLGKGCTSGHGVCGVGRAAPRSIFATIIFLIFGILTASMIHLLKEGL